MYFGPYPRYDDKRSEDSTAELQQGGSIASKVDLSRELHTMVFGRDHVLTADVAFRRYLAMPRDGAHFSVCARKADFHLG